MGLLGRGTADPGISVTDFKIRVPYVRAYQVVRLYVLYTSFQVVLISVFGGIPKHYSFTEFVGHVYGYPSSY